MIKTHNWQKNTLHIQKIQLEKNTYWHNTVITDEMKKRKG